MSKKMTGMTKTFLIALMKLLFVVIVRIMILFVKIKTVNLLICSKFGLIIKSLVINLK